MCDDEYWKWRLDAQRSCYTKLIAYVSHTNKCILSFWEAGEPTKDGGYRTKFKGKWYQSKPVDETPKCDCGLDEAIKRAEEIV